MKLQEADAKSLLVAQGLPVPDWAVSHTAEEARDAATRFLTDGPVGGKVVIKAQVLVGGRGKAGGVKLAGSPEEAEALAAQILGMDIKGFTVRKLLVGPAADIVREFYLAAVLDRAERRILLMGSAEGGVEIESVAEEHPEAIVRVHADPTLGLHDFQAREMAFALGLGGHLKDAVRIAKGVVATMRTYDADLVEINPLAIVREGDPGGTPVERLVCLDAKITLDDSALGRHPGLEDLRDPDEEAPEDRAAREAGLTFIKLDGSIGCMVNGAGLAMATMDIIKLYGMEPANFLDVGGGASKEKVAAAFKIILSDANVKGILVNIFGGIMRCDIIAEGVVAAAKEMAIKVPLVVRLEGTNVELGKDILAKSGLKIVPADNLADAAKKITDAVEKAA